VRDGARTPLKVLTFEAAKMIFAVRAEDVGKVVASTRTLPAGTSVVDIVGLLADSGPGSDRSCVVLMKGKSRSGAAVAVTATRAMEIVTLDIEKLLPLPGFLFRGGNPFLGMIPGEPAAIFLLAEPSRLLEAAAAS
jgi:hypothetical protein